MNVGDVKQLNPTWTPTNATNVVPRYRSSNPSILSVSDMGTLRAHAPGTVILTMKIGKKKGNYTFEVIDDTAAESVAINKTELMLPAGRTEQLTASVLPSNASQAVMWISSDPAIATVGSSGSVQGVKPGKVTITARTMNGFKSGQCEVTVYEPVVTGIATLNAPVYLTHGKMLKLPLVITPANAPDKMVTWTSSHPSVVEVNVNGEIKAMEAKGQAVITATSRDGGLKAQVTVHVDSDSALASQALTGLQVLTPVLTMRAGETAQIVAETRPVNAANTIITYESLTPTIASVDALGKVTAIAGGPGQVIARAGTHSQVVTVHVNLIVD